MDKTFLLLLFLSFLSCRFEQSPVHNAERNRPLHLPQESPVFLLVEDSLRHALEIADSLEIILNEHTDEYHQAIFAVFNRDSHYYQELNQFFVTLAGLPENRMDALRADWSTPDSVRKALSEQVEPLRGNWIRLYLYNGNHYVYIPCGLDTFITLSDSALYDFSAGEPPSIVTFDAFKGGASGELELSVRQGRYQTVTLYPYPGLADNESVRIFGFSAPDVPHRYELMVKLEEAGRFPLIVNSCTFSAEGLARVIDPDGTLDLAGYEYSFTPPDFGLTAVKEQGAEGWWWVTDFIDSIPKKASIAHSYQNLLLESVYLLYVEKERWTAIGRKRLSSEQFGSTEGIPFDATHPRLFPVYANDTLKLTSRLQKGRQFTFTCRRPSRSEETLFTGMGNQLRPALLEERIANHLTAILLAGSYVNRNPQPDAPSRLILDPKGNVTGFKPFTRYRMEDGLTPSRPHVLRNGVSEAIDLITFSAGQPGRQAGSQRENLPGSQAGSQSGSQAASKAEGQAIAFWEWKLKDDLLELHEMVPRNEPGRYEATGRTLLFRRER